MKEFSLNQLPLLIWMGLIFWLSSIPRIPVIHAPIEIDKVVHTSVFFVLCWFSYRAFRYQSRVPSFRDHALILALVLTALYGITDEIHQRFVPGRTFDYFDMLADASGAVAFAIILLLRAAVKRRSGRRETPTGGG